MARVVSGKPRTTSDPRLVPGENLVEVFRNQVGRRGDKTALMSKVDGRWVGVSWRQFGENVLALGATFLSLGVRRGDRIAIFGYNSPAWAYADLASLTMGAVNVPIYFRSKAPQAEYILRDSEARGIVVGGKDQLETVLSIWDGLPALEWVIAREGAETAGRAGVISLEQALAGPNDPHAPHGSASERSELLAKAAGAAAEVRPDDLATIIYTSGTTGKPKGVMLTHRNLLADAWAIAQLLPQISEKDVALSFMPTSHVLDRICVHCLNLLGGGTVAYAQSLETVMQNLGDVRPTALVAVPRVFEKVYLAIHDKMAAAPASQRRLFDWAVKVGERIVEARRLRRRPGLWIGLQYRLAEALIYKRIRAAFGGRMLIFASGGAHLQEKIDVFFRVIGIPISHGFGLTEAACTVTTSTLDDFKPGTLGHPIPGVEVTIADDGEILVRGDIVMAGYYKREAETAAALAGGWLHTGDLGYLDEDGYLVMTDRKKDILSTSGGKNISPQKIETLLKLDRTVEQAVVIAEGRPYVTALIVPNFAEVAAFLQREGLPPTGPGEAVRLEAVRMLYQGVVDRVNEGFDSYEQIKRFALLPEEITEESGGVTHTLKVKRRVIDEIYRGVIEGIYR